MSLNLEISDKNNPETNTCFGKNYTSFYQGINKEFKDTFFFEYFIQLIIIALIYFNMGKVGLLGGILEHSTLAYICKISQKENKTRVYTFFIGEFFWIIAEYSIPYLNLLKMETIAEKRGKRIIEWIVYIFFIPFVIARLFDGYDRMMEGVLNTKISEQCHGVAVKTNSTNVTTVMSYFMNSSYTILILIDIVSFFLSVLYLVTTFLSSNNDLSSSPMPFHCIKTVFLMILAVDALIFRHEHFIDLIVCNY
ncbi:hypothetical protein H8356DRAFT_1285598 [Neocallimastix lanati (nom. inval.)]|nr:hypothetical protein H8356DRAFT_1285598 [Neocallimastix sp. JGI-2020a]